MMPLFFSPFAAAADMFRFLFRHFLFLSSDYCHATFSDYAIAVRFAAA